MGKRAKHQEIKKHKIKSILFVILVIIFITSMIYMCFYFYDIYKSKSTYKNILENVEISEDKILEEENEIKTERMLKLEELQKQNNEIIGWIEIKDTNINYPVLQTTDNEYYLSHNYKKEKMTGGSIFLDKNFDLDKPSTNYLIYGHRSKQGLMFEDLLKFAKEDFYKGHKEISFTTNKEDATYEILAVFYSKVYYKSDTNVFRYYYFIDANNEQEYNDFVNNAKKASIYNTGVEANVGEQLLTLSTCEYSQENGRFVVVAKKKSN